MSLNRNRGFTLLELLLAISILAVISGVAYMTFSTVVTSWRRGMALGDDLHHGDFVMEQLVTALRSAYYPDAKGKGDAYGMVTEDVGSGSSAADTVSWVKLGGSLVGKTSRLADSAHRVKFSLETNEDGDQAAAVKAWMVQGQPDGFDPENVPPVFLSSRVVGFNIRTAYRKVDDEIEWLDNWEETNKLPTVVEATLYLQPLEEGQEPIELKRVFGIPVGQLCWR